MAVREIDPEIGCKEWAATPEAVKFVSSPSVYFPDPLKQAQMSGSLEGVAGWIEVGAGLKKEGPQISPFPGHY